MFALEDDAQDGPDHVLGEHHRRDRYHGRPVRDIWRNRPDLSPHDALVPAVALDETNPAATLEAKASSELDLDFDDRFSLLLWTMVKGEDVPYPEAKRQRPLERIGQ